MSTANLQKAYMELAEQSDDLQAGRIQRCNCCGEFYRASEFYQRKDFKVGFILSSPHSISVPLESNNFSFLEFV